MVRLEKDGAAMSMTTPRAGGGRDQARAIPAALLAVALCGLVIGCRTRPPEPLFSGEPFLLVWAGDADRLHSDFLAVIDADPTSPQYGTVRHTVPVGSAANEPYAMERELTRDGLLFAGGLLTGRTFVFDVNDPLNARLVYVDDPGPERQYAAPRAYLQLPSGHRVATAGDRRDYRGDVVELLHSPGGLVEFTRGGRLLRELDADDPAAAGMLISPHGVAVSFEADRLLTTDAGHGYTPTALEWVPGVSVQVRKASTGNLIQTIPLPVGHRGDENLGPRTVHFLSRGTRTLVSTAEGGALYASWTVATSTPTFSLVYDFGSGALPGDSAITPNERYYLQALIGANRLVVLDISDVKEPRSVNNLRFDRDPERPNEPREGGPSALALSTDGRRLAVANYTIDVPALRRDGDRRVYLVHIDPESGAVGFDGTFRDELDGTIGLDFNRNRWPHGETGPARPAALLFAVPRIVPGANGGS